MKYLFPFTDLPAALGFSHELRLRAWPNSPVISNPKDVPYLFPCIEHPTTGEGCVKIPESWTGYLTEDEQADLQDTLPAGWEPEPEDLP